MAAQVGGVGRVAGRIEGLSEPRVAPAVLGEAMGDLHDRARRPFGKPAPRKKAVTVVGTKGELALRHRLPPPRSLPY